VSDACFGSTNETWGQADRQFKESAPYSSVEEVGRHFGYSVAFPPYDLSQEKFRIVIPESYSTNEDWGLVVWISPENQAHVPSQLLQELAPRHLLLVAAYKSGNDRHPLDRFRLALDGTCNMCRSYRVDRRRIYVAGFSGGSRMASMLGVAYGDLFSGTLCVCGVNFYRLIQSSEREQYPAAYDPAPTSLARAKHLGRFVLLTGEADPNRLNTQTLSQKGFKREGFKNVLYLEVKGMGHEVPPGPMIAQALDFLAPP
jgi:poly(3-hydroxybutyrate) depolymerase